MIAQIESQPTTCEVLLSIVTEATFYMPPPDLNSSSSLLLLKSMPVPPSPSISIDIMHMLQMKSPLSCFTKQLVQILFWQ